MPVIYATFGTWQHPQVRPKSFVLGSFWVMNRLRWFRWGAHEADGRGTDTFSAGAGAPVHKWPTVIRLSGVKSHAGYRYYSRMVLTSRGHRTIRLMYRLHGWFQQ